VRQRKRERVRQRKSDEIKIVGEVKKESLRECETEKERGRYK